MSNPSRLEHVELGYVQRAQGLKGEVRLRLYNEASEVLSDIDQVFLRGPGELPQRPFKLKSLKRGGKERIALFAGVEDRTAAEALVGATVWIRREQLPKLGPDEFYHFELIGLTAVDVNGRSVGVLEEVFDGPANDLYVVRGREIGEVLVPAIGTYVGKIDLENSTIQILELDSLLES